MPAVSVRNIVAFIWACFVGILLIYIVYPFWNVFFGSMLWNNLILKYTMEIVVMLFVFTVGFYVPFKAFTSYSEERGWNIDKPV